MKLNWQICLTLTAMLLTACATTPAPTRSPLSVPGPQNSPLQVPSPLRTPVPGPASKIVPFRLNKPIVEGVDKVNGTGPAGVPVVLADVTFGGNALGTATIGSDGTFVIKTPVLEKSHQVGLALGNLTGTRWSPEDFYPTGYQGSEAMLVPQVGFFYDTAMIQAK